MDEAKARDQNTSEGPVSKLGASTGPKPLDFAMDDRLKLSLQYAAQHSGKKPEDQSSKTDDGSKDQDRKDGSTGQDHVHNIPRAKKNVQDTGLRSEYHGHEDSHAGQRRYSRLRKCKTYSHPKPLKKSNYRKGDIDTTAPFESVKAAVSMFGGIDWKAHKLKMAERRKNVAQELSKAHEEIQLIKKNSEAAEESKEQVLKELDTAKRRLEELKLNLENAQTEDEQAKQDAELINLRLEEMEQGIANERSFAAKVQLEVAQGRHQSAVSELEAVRIELENLQKDYDLLVSDKDLALKDAEEAVFNSNEIEKNVDDLTIKLMTTKEALESVHGARLEAEEMRNEAAMAGDSAGGSDIEEEYQQMAETGDLESKLDANTVLVEYLKAELESYMEETHKEIQSEVDLARTNLAETNKNIEKATYEVNNLKMHIESLKSELEQGKKDSPWQSAEEIESELNRIKSELTGIEAKEQESLEKTTELSKQLQEATEEADLAKSRARKARKELKKAKQAAKGTKKEENSMNTKLTSVTKEIEAARASERLAVGAINAQETESARSNESETEAGITVSVEKYDELSRKAKEAEDEANDRVSEAISQIDLAKRSEVKAERKLEEVRCDLACKKEQLTKSRRMAEKAEEGRVAVEAEVRVWNEERRRREGKEEGVKMGMTGEGITCRKKKKRGGFFQRFFLCFCSKGHSNKIST